jgi:TPR repeat protein
MALQILRPLAEKGGALAEFNLGQMHARGLGVQRDYTEAIAWIRKAADQGLAIAQHDLGLAESEWAKCPGVPSGMSLGVLIFRSQPTSTIRNIQM